MKLNTRPGTFYAWWEKTDPSSRFLGANVRHWRFSVYASRGWCLTVWLWWRELKVYWYCTPKHYPVDCEDYDEWGLETERGRMEGNVR